MPGCKDRDHFFECTQVLFEQTRGMCGRTLEAGLRIGMEGIHCEVSSEGLGSWMKNVNKHWRQASPTEDDIDSTPLEF